MYPQYQSTPDDEDEQQQDPLQSLQSLTGAPSAAPAAPDFGLTSLMSSMPPAETGASAPDAGAPMQSLAPLTAAPLDSAPVGTVGTTGIPRNPYDSAEQDMLKQMLDANSARIDGITADRNKLRDESNSLTNNLGNDVGTTGAALGATLIAALGGAKLGYATGAGAAGAKEYSNNLEAQEKQRQLQIAEALKNDDSQLGDLTKYDQSLSELPLKTQQELALAYGKGDVPDTTDGETPFAAKQKAEQDLADAKTKASVANTPLLPDQKQYWSQQLHVDPDTINTMGDIARLQKEQRLQQAQDRLTGKGNAASAKTAAANNVGTMVSPIDPSVPLSTLNQKEIETSHAAFMPIISSLDDLKNSVAQFGNANLGTIGAQQKADIAQYVLQVRKFYGEGARLTENVQQLDQNALGAAVLGENTPEALMQNVTGTDLVKMINDAQAKLLGTFEARAEANNGTLDLGKFAKFQPEQAQALSSIASNYKIRLGVGLPTAAAGGGGGIDYSSAPPGMTPAQFSQWKQQQLGAANNGN